MVRTAAELVGSRGVAATSFSAVLATSRAPRGSIYYYFPEGKRQLIQASVEWTQQLVLDHQRACAARTPAGVLEHFVRFFRRSVVSSECTAGCPIAAVAVGSYARELPLQSAVRAGFRSWLGLLSRQLEARGVARAEARSLALTTLASVEGALVLCRAEGRVAPLDAVRRQLRFLANRLSS